MKSKTLSTIANLLSSLQKRITKTAQKTQANTEAIENLRKAQNDFAIANGAFLAGPAANDTPPSVWSKVGQGK